MKKIFLLVIVTVGCLQVTVNAQKSKVGFALGVSSSNLNGKEDGLTVNNNSRVGYTFGMIVDAPLGKGIFSFQPGLHYVQKGAETFEDQSRLEYTALRYLEFQGNIMLNSKGAKTGGGSFFFGAGPSIAFGLPSKFVVENKRDGTSVETGLVWGKESSSNLRTVDLGANFLTGFRFKQGFYFSLNYTLGVRDLLPESPAIPKADEVKNTAFGFRIGMLLNNPKQ